MELTVEQKDKVKQWVKEGAGLSEIQRKLTEELGLTLTFMDVRFLVIDLGVDVRDKPVVRNVPGPVQSEREAGPAGGSAKGLAGKKGEGISSGVSVDVDRVTRPGSVVSGKVVFSDGVSAAWFLDQTGRLALDAKTPGYAPSEADVAAFQMELRKQLERRGF